MTLNDHFWLNSFYAGTSRIFCVYFENNCVKINKGRPILLAGKMFSMDSSFWRYKVCADICGGSPNSYHYFRQTYVYLTPYVVFFSEILKIAIL